MAKFRVMRSLISLVFLVCLSACAFAQSGPQPTLPLSPLTIDTQKGTANFTVELASTWPQQETGLMFRKSVGPNEGMLFDFGHDDYRSFWMKNTLVPLDMVFIRSDGRIMRIAAMTTPLSTDAVPSYAKVQGVLEIAGGRAAELGLREGDIVHHKIFKN